MGVMVLATWPRVGAYDQLLAENLALRVRLDGIDQKLEEADAALHRIRLYDAQLRLVGTSPLLPGFGPLDDEDAEALGGPMFAEELPGEESDQPDDLEGEPMEEHDPFGFSDELDPNALRPAEAWASRLDERLDEFLGLAEELEPRLNLLTLEAGDMFSYEAAFPSVWPVDGRLTSGFGWRRSPISRSQKMHSGVDVSAPRGTPVRATASGTIVMARYNSGYGRMVAIDHGYGITSRYAHNSRLMVREGDWVEAGEMIATVGSTGQSTGPHLHFEMLVDGRFVDPMDYLPQ
jgi:murein DD-endopeptidase MepM/ murein hydrolase activator NlpD